MRAAEPTVDGGTVRYPGVLDGAELVYDVTGESLKENILLARPPTDPTYRFTLQARGVTARAQPDGSIGFFGDDRLDGPPLFVMPAPFMTDSRDDVKSPHGKVFSDKVT